ncbi:hypothetical protein AB6A40_003175 [Gnathostoma spinigerum]|uniref:NADH dehydrogenase [ubiquinone] 1 alpha subcomplex subunit 12 n=1 Tax=Gnathostoma spinigerum TaxID=75299 RepID=A0ABD6EGF0_9BILA
MSRPGNWAKAWELFKKSLSGKYADKKYIGEDAEGNRFYELIGTRHNVTRGYDPSPTSNTKPAHEWQAWLKRTRRFPPSPEEIATNRLQQQDFRNILSWMSFHCWLRCCLTNNDKNDAQL